MVPHFPRPVAFAMRLSRSLWAKTRLDGLPLIAGMLSHRLVSTIHRGCCDKTPDFHGLCQTEGIPWAADRWAGAPAPARRPPAKAPCRILMPKFNDCLSSKPPAWLALTDSSQQSNGQRGQFVGK